MWTKGGTDKSAAHPLCTHVSEHVQNLVESMPQQINAKSKEIPYLVLGMYP